MSSSTWLAHHRRSVRAVLGGARVLWGVTALVSPTANLRILAIRPQDPVDGHYLSRLFATREVTVGAFSSGVFGQATATTACRTGVAVDAVDVLSLVAAYRRGKVTLPAALTIGGLGVIAVAAGLLVSGDEPA